MDSNSRPLNFYHCFYNHSWGNVNLTMLVTHYWKLKRIVKLDCNESSADMYLCESRLLFLKEDFKKISRQRFFVCDRLRVKAQSTMTVMSDNLPNQPNYVTWKFSVETSIYCQNFLTCNFISHKLDKLYWPHISRSVRNDHCFWTQALLALDVKGRWVGRKEV